MKEPIIHSHITDILDEDHPLADTTIYCDKCKEMLHASENECMQSWIETGKGNFCLTCFSKMILIMEYNVLEEEWGLK